MKNFILLLLIISADPWTDAMLRITGASCMEELEEDEMERFEHMHAHPLDLNMAGSARLSSSGLFDKLQILSIVAYRNEYGDILSFNELALISGFSEEYCKALQEFVVLKSSSPPGQKHDSRSVDGNITLRGAVKATEGNTAQYSYGLKTDVSIGSSIDMRWASRTTYTDKTFRLGTLSGAWYGKRAVSKVVLGNYSARFGQGLTQWSGFSLSGFTSLNSFRKTGGGLTATSSFSSELLGAGIEMNISRFNFTASASFNDGFKQICNISWTGKSSSLGLTSSGNGIGLDWRAGLGKTSVFGELTYRSGPAAIIGALFHTDNSSGFAVQARYLSPAYKKDWSGIAAAYENSWMTLTADAAYHIANDKRQHKSIILIHPEFNRIHPELRASVRWRPSESPGLRLDLRGDLGYENGRWQFNGRYNVLWYRGFAWLWYIESGYASELLKTFARFSIFCIDNWDDRIYVYERDAPGTFNVPAYYGRGLSASVTARLKAGRSHSLNARFSCVAYPWNKSPKPAQFEAKLQYTFHFHSYPDRLFSPGRP